MHIILDESQSGEWFYKARARFENGEYPNSMMIASCRTDQLSGDLGYHMGEASYSRSLAQLE